MKIGSIERGDVWSTDGFGFHPAEVQMMELGDQIVIAAPPIMAATTSTVSATRPTTAAPATVAAPATEAIAAPATEAPPAATRLGGYRVGKTHPEHCAWYDVIAYTNIAICSGISGVICSDREEMEMLTDALGTPHVPTIRHAPHSTKKQSKKTIYIYIYICHARRIAPTITIQAPGGHPSCGKTSRRLGAHDVNLSV